MYKFTSIAATKNYLNAIKVRAWSLHVAAARGFTRIRVWAVTLQKLQSYLHLGIEALLYGSLFALNEQTCTVLP